MINNKIQINQTIGSIFKPMPYASVIALILIGMLFTFSDARSQTERPQVAYSKDSTLVSFEVYGEGETTLVFVHGWSCDSRYWRNQIPEFSQNYKVVLVDLAGHGHSGVTRETYSMKAFGEDVQAVVEASESQNVILIGHSMGGAVIAEAAHLMPKRVIGIIGIDTYRNIEYSLSQDNYNMMIKPMQTDFRSGTSQFVEKMLYQQTDNSLNEWIKADMSAAQPSIALNAMEEYMSQFMTGRSSLVFETIQIPVMAVTGDRWKINYEANRRHMYSFDAIVIENADHFLMVNKPDKFNKALNMAVESINHNKKK